MHFIVCLHAEPATTTVENPSIPIETATTAMGAEITPDFPEEEPSSVEPPQKRRRDVSRQKRSGSVEG